MFNASDLVKELDWLDDSACAGLEIPDFFVDAGRVISDDVLEICRACPVRLECIKHAIDENLTNGYFGGLSYGQRKNMTVEQAAEHIKKDPPRKAQTK